LVSNSLRFLVGSAVLTVLVGAIVAPYFLLDIFALTAIAFVISQQFLKNVEWPDWLPGRPLTIRSRIMVYARITRPHRPSINAGIGTNSFERSVLGRSDPLSISDAELSEMKFTREE
jgi:hypothetical protein